MYSVLRSPNVRKYSFATMISGTDYAIPENSAHTEKRSFAISFIRSCHNDWLLTQDLS